MFNNYLYIMKLVEILYKDMKRQPDVDFEQWQKEQIPIYADTLINLINKSAIDKQYLSGDDYGELVFCYFKLARSRFEIPSKYITIARYLIAHKLSLSPMER